MKTTKRTKRIHYITNAVGTQDRTYAASKRTILSKAVDKYKVMAALVKRLYNA